jgi:RNA polymerase sigma-70 factor (ECF subfamily)
MTEFVRAAATPGKTESASELTEAPVEISPAQHLEALVHGVAAGEQAALAELHDATVAKLYGLARLILRNVADAEEVVCDTYTQVWQAASRYDSSRGSVLGWMLTICRSRAIDLLRQRKTRERLPLEENDGHDLEPLAGGEPDALLNALQQGSAVRRALEGLSPVRRELVSMAFLQGLSHQEIAEQTGLPIGTVKSHIRRALAALRTDLQIWNDHDAASN